MPDHEQGDEYARRLATFIRLNEKSLAEGGLPRRRPTRAKQDSDASSFLNPLGWFGPTAPSATPPKPIIMSIDTHHLFYILMRMEEQGLPVGTLDVQVDSPSRPMNYINLFPDADKAETLSLASFRSSLSVVSNLSLGGGWFGKSHLPTIEAELKYIYSSFTKLPALCVTAPGHRVIAELANEPPNENALPLDSFKNIMSLECIDIDPRILLGWDRLAESLRSLKIRKSGLEDISDIFVGAVVDDQARREGSTSRKRRRRIPIGPERQASFYGTKLPEVVPEDTDGEGNHSPTTPSPADMNGGSPKPPKPLSSLKWAFLKHLSLADNALAFFPSDLISYLTHLTHLDLSSNLLVSVPPGLGALFNLVSLNLSDNMIDSVLGIYQNLGQVLYLNLSHNRLESICGLERLHALERVDLRNNVIDDVAEIGRLATLPNITEISVEGNPLTEDEGYRVACFDIFWKEGKSITLDGLGPTYSEKRGLTVPPSQQMSSSRPISVAQSPPIVAVGHSHNHRQSLPPHQALSEPSPSSSTTASPNLAPVGAIGVVGKARKKKVKRIVDLDGHESDGSSKSSAGHGHRQMRSDQSGVGGGNVKQKAVARSLTARKEWGRFEDVLEGGKPSFSDVPAPARPAPLPPSATPPKSFSSPKAKPSRHTRHQTEQIYSGISSLDDAAASSSVNSIGGDGSQSLCGTRGSSQTAWRSAARRARLSASVFESPPDAEEVKDSAEAYRRRIEALKQDMGDGWLKVFSQTQMTSPTL